jgi:hypothetical protein
VRELHLVRVLILIANVAIVGYLVRPKNIFNLIANIPGKPVTQDRSPRWPEIGCFWDVLCDPDQASKRWRV